MTDSNDQETPAYKPFLVATDGAATPAASAVTANPARLVVTGIGSNGEARVEFSGDIAESLSYFMRTTGPKPYRSPMDQTPLGREGRAAGAPKETHFEGETGYDVQPPARDDKALKELIIAQSLRPEDDTHLG